MGPVPQEMLTACAEMSTVWTSYSTPDLTERKRKTGWCPISALLAFGCGPPIAATLLPNTNCGFGGLCVKRTWLVVGWFVLLFLFNLVVHKGPVGNHPIIEYSLNAVEYFFAPIEIIASIVAIFLILRTGR